MMTSNPPPSSSAAEYDTSAPTVPPPGWYRDGAAHRWWDGSEWTAYTAPAQGVTTTDSDDRTLSMIAHAGIAAGGFLLPMTLYLISDEQRRPATRHHAREALNFQLTFLGAYVLAVAAMFAGVVAGSTIGSNPAAPGFGIVIALAVVGMGVLFVGNIACSVVGAVRAGRGERWRYPVRIPFVTG